MTTEATVLVHDAKGQFMFHRNFTDRAQALSYANGECARGRYAVTTRPSPEYA